MAAWLVLDNYTQEEWIIDADTLEAISLWCEQNNHSLIKQLYA